MPAKINYEIGSVIGENGCTYLGDSGVNNQNIRLGSFECLCGIKFTTRIDRVKSGHTSSCGCMQKAKTSKSNTKHGLSSHRLYKVWKGIKDRCFNDGHAFYSRYGGRGVSVCVEWSNSPEAFVNWCIANGWRDGLEIDRIDNDGNYEPNNCRFVTHKENCRNRPQFKGDENAHD